MLKPIGLLGGTFDPIHNGHLQAALKCYESLDLAEVRFVPLCMPAHRNTPTASPEQRLAMLQLAIDRTAGLNIDDREIRRGGTSYTIDTLKALRDESDSQPLCIIMGMDVFQKLNTWHQWTLILEYSHIIVTDRPGSKLQIKEKDIAEIFTEHSTTRPVDLHKQPAGYVYKLDMPMPDISSTLVRQQINTDSDLSTLIPGEVSDYIEGNGLYKKL